MRSESEDFVLHIETCLYAEEVDRLALLKAESEDLYAEELESLFRMDDNIWAHYYDAVGKIVKRVSPLSLLASQGE